jgi:hypothetical protein
MDAFSIVVSGAPAELLARHNWQSEQTAIAATAVVCDRADVLRWLHARGAAATTVSGLLKGSGTGDALGNAIHWGAKNVLSWIDQQGFTDDLIAPYRDRETSLVNFAVYSGDPAVLAWVRDRAEVVINIWRLSDWAMTAAGRGHVALMEWMREQGMLTLAACRANYCGALRTALGNNAPESVRWLHAFGAASIEDCQKNIDAREVGIYPDSAIRWLFDKLPRATFRDADYRWRAELARRQGSALTLLLCGQRRPRLRLPPEIWENCVLPLLMPYGS